MLIVVYLSTKISLYSLLSLLHHFLSISLIHARNLGRSNLVTYLLVKLDNLVSQLVHIDFQIDVLFFLVCELALQL